MPIYNYQCNQCDARFELLIRGGDLPACPDCGSTAVTQGLSLTGRMGRTERHIAAARRQAAAEGHFSNYSSAERNKAGV